MKNYLEDVNSLNEKSDVEKANIILSLMLSNLKITTLEFDGLDESILNTLEQLKLGQTLQFIPELDWENINSKTINKIWHDMPEGLCDILLSLFTEFEIEVQSDNGHTRGLAQYFERAVKTERVHNTLAKMDIKKWNEIEERLKCIFKEMNQQIRDYMANRKNYSEVTIEEANLLDCFVWMAAVISSKNSINLDFESNGKWNDLREYYTEMLKASINKENQFAVNCYYLAERLQKPNPIKFCLSSDRKKELEDDYKKLVAEFEKKFMFRE